MRKPGHRNPTRDRPGSIPRHNARMRNKSRPRRCLRLRTSRPSSPTHRRGVRGWREQFVCILRIPDLAVLQGNNFNSPETASEVRLAENRANALFKSFLGGSSLELDACQQAENDQRNRARPAHCKLIVALVSPDISVWRAFGNGE